MAERSSTVVNREIAVAEDLAAAGFLQLDL
jgi:hypothetical protein